MTHSKKAIDLIKKFEGVKLKPYLCPKGVRTVGYGTTRPLGRPMLNADFSITKEQAVEYLEHDVKNLDDIVTALTKGAEMTQGMHDACVSFCYNLGAGNFSTSSLLKRIKEGKKTEAADEFLKWDNMTVNGQLKKLAGLTKRRTAERELFLS